MWRERTLKVVLVLVGLVFSAGVYPMTMCLRQPHKCGSTDVMMLSLYVTLGIFLLMAARNPAANRSLIAFTAWSSLAHAALMSTQAMRNIVARGELIGADLALGSRPTSTSGYNTPTTASGLTSRICSSICAT